MSYRRGLSRKRCGIRCSSAGLTRQRYTELSPIALPQMEAGNARILGIVAPQWQSGKFARIPTMREEGMNITGIANWRRILKIHARSWPISGS